MSDPSFARPHHQAIATVLEGLDGEILREHRCLFGGGTSMVMRFGEWRESSDIDLLVSDREGYKHLRELITADGISALGDVPTLREVTADRYGIRTLLNSPSGPIRFEIVFEGRITLDAPTTSDSVCGLSTLTVADMVATKLLANDDRWADRALFNRDIIDLAMLPASDTDWQSGHRKSVDAYGASIDAKLANAADFVVTQPDWLETCARQLQMTDTDLPTLRDRIQLLRDR